MYLLNRASGAMKWEECNYQNHENIPKALILEPKAILGYLNYHFHYWNVCLFLIANLKVFFLSIINR